MGVAQVPFDYYQDPPLLPVGRNTKPLHGLRDYQVEAVEAIRGSLRENRSTLLVMATGLGKTQVFSEMARQWPTRVLVLAHRDELISQARDRLEQMLGEVVGVEKGGWVSDERDRVVVGSVQTVHREKRMKEMGDFGLVIVDEAHHYTARTFRKPIEYFSNAKVLGVTATPDRGDEQALGQIFDDVAYTMDIRDGIDRGWLVDLNAYRVRLEEINLDAVGKSAGDLAAGQLDAAMVKAVEGIVNQTLEREPNRQGIAFFPGVQSAEFAANVFNRYRADSAICISGETPADERRRLTDAFRQGRYKYMCNCQIATEGFDAPGVSLIIQGRPTLSRALYAQMVGRGTRVLPGVVDGQGTAEARKDAISRSSKSDCVILDFVGNTDKHSLVSMVDVLGGDYTPQEVALAKKKEKKIGDGAMSARALLEASRRELKAIAAAQQARVEARSWQVDPFKVIGVARDSVNFLDQRYGFKPMSPKQRAALIKLGFSERELDGVGKRGAQAMFTKVSERIDKGLASFKQLRAIRKYAPCSDDLTFVQAHKALDYIFSGKRRDPAVLQAILDGEHHG